MEVVHPELHEQVLRESTNIFINQHLDIGRVAPGLARDFNDAMSTFLKHNGFPTTGQVCMRWLHNLEAIFVAAVEFQAQVISKGPSYSFYWPRTDYLYDPETMTSTEVREKNDQEKVQMALFPALIRKMGDGIYGGGRQTVLQAPVILQ